MTLVTHDYKIYINVKSNIQCNIVKKNIFLITFSINSMFLMI